jgi:hypothetical protein
MKRLDAALTATVVTVAGCLVALFGISVLMEAAVRWNEGNDYTFTQGIYVVKTPGSSEPVRIPVIQRDGSLRPEVETKGFDAAVLQFHPVAWAPAEWLLSQATGESAVSHLTGTDYLTQQGEQWVWSPRVGILLYDLKSKLIGSLTDDGFVPGRIRAASFKRALSFYPSFGPVDHLGFFAYVTPEGFYRADLTDRRIVRIAELDEPANLQVGKTYPAPHLFAFGRNKIHWTEARPGGRFGSFDVPEEIRKVAPKGQYSVAFGEDDRLILRAPHAQEIYRTASRYTVAVLSAEGNPIDAYEYDVNVKGGRLYDGTLSEGWFSHILGEWASATPPGKVAQCLMAPLLRKVYVRSQMSRAYEYYLQDFHEGFGGTWLGLAVSLLVAAAVVVRAHWRRRPWSQTVAWALLAAAVGIPAALAHVLLVRPARLETCPSCGRRQLPMNPRCQKCGAAVQGPMLEGVEILVKN